ncbi:MAG: hypothetical protein WC805_01195 [Patescibacteria group bacterium]|jgi:hypothetical protein
MAITRSAVSANYELAEEIFRILLEALRQGRYPYNLNGTPQLEENLPSETVMPRGGIEEAIFWFVSCFYMQGGINSHTAIQALFRVYAVCPELFQPSTWLKETTMADYSEQLRQVLKNNGLGFRLEDTVKSWSYDLHKLAKYWDGDPRKLVEEGEFADLCAKIIRSNKKDADPAYGFRGFQEKMVSMITFFLMDRNLVVYRHMPLPVDFHVLRVLVSTRILEGFPETNCYRREDFLDIAREVTYNYCCQHEKECDKIWLRLCDAIWLLSRNGCSKSPGNSSKRGEYQARQTKVTPSHPEPKSGSSWCHLCPLNKEYCQFNVPAARYYVNDLVETRGSREKEPYFDFEFK